MKKWCNKLFSIAFSFMFAFLSIGYAELADAMTITGEAFWEYQGVVITSVECVDTGEDSITSNGVSYISPTNLENKIRITGDWRTPRNITYKITVLNKSLKYKYSYKGIVCDTELSGYNNDQYREGSAYNTNENCFKVITKVNTRLKMIGKELDLSIPITTYVARHTQATVMKRAGVPTAVISQIMGHSSEKVTQIYLDHFDNEQIDEAMQHLL